jgi:hypothetical protein
MKRLSSICIGCALLALAAGSAGAAVKKAEIIAAVQAAFETWSKVPCANLKFEYKGELPSFISEKQGAILVYWGYDSLTWTSQAPVLAGAYVQNDDTAALTRAVIGFDAHNWGWSIGTKEKYTFDIQTAVTQMLPVALGFYVGADPTGKLLWLYPEYIQTALTPMQEQGAQFLYFNSSGSCTKPNPPSLCGVTPTVDRGVLDGARDLGAAPDKRLVDLTVVSGDGPPPQYLCVKHSTSNGDAHPGAYYHWEGTIPWYIYLNDTYGHLPGGILAPDGGVHINDLGIKPDAKTNGGGSDGCCRVSHAQSGASGALVVLSLLSVLLLVARRRRR